VYEYLEAEGFQYTIRLPANQVLQAQIAHLLTRPVGRPPHYVRRFYASFRYQAQSWSRSRRVVAKVEWHPGELYARVGFIVTNLHRSVRRVVAFYNGRGTAEQWIKEGKHAVKWTRLSCTTFQGNAVRLQLHALAYNLANFLRTLAVPSEVERWSLTSLREKVVKIGAKVIAHGRYVIFQMAEVALPRELFGRILDRIEEAATAGPGPMLTLAALGGEEAGVGVRPECGNALPPVGRNAIGRLPGARSGRQDGRKPLPARSQGQYPSSGTGIDPLHLGNVG